MCICGLVLQAANEAVKSEEKDLHLVSVEVVSMSHSKGNNSGDMIRKMKCP